MAIAWLLLIFSGENWCACAEWIYMQIFGWAYNHYVLVVALYVCVCMCVSPPFQWVDSVLLVLVQWARPCIRQVELQGQFCNTWPVSLSHLRGWRKRGKVEEGERERAREGRAAERRAAQVVRGDWRDEWQWKVIERGSERTTAGGAGGRKNEMTVPSYFFFLTSFLSPSLSLSPIPRSLSFIQQPLKQAWLSSPASHYSQLQQ